MKRAIFSIVFVLGCALWAYAGWRKGYEAGWQAGADAQAQADLRLSVDRGHAEWICGPDGQGMCRWFPSCREAELARRDEDACRRAIAAGRIGTRDVERVIRTSWITGGVR